MITFSAIAYPQPVLAKAEVADTFLTLLVLTVPAESIVPHLALVANVLLILNFAAPTERAQVACAPRLTLVFPLPFHRWTSVLPGPSAASKSAKLSRTLGVVLFSVAVASRRRQ